MNALPLRAYRVVLYSDAGRPVGFAGVFLTRGEARTEAARPGRPAGRVSRVTLDPEVAARMRRGMTWRDAVADIARREAP